jgi:hypothetical protein
MQWFLSWWQRSLPLYSPPLSLSPSFIDANRPSSSPLALASGVPPPWNKPSLARGEQEEEKAGSWFLRTGGIEEEGRIRSRMQQITRKKRRKLSYFEGNVVWLEVQKHADLIEVVLVVVDLGPGFIPLK